MSAAYSYAQLKAALWVDAGARVHAVVDGLVVPQLPAKLAAARVAGWDCLQRGALSADAADRAPYLVELVEDAPFTDWLLGEATAAFAGWGVLMVSAQPMLPMREHCRNLADVVLPDGTRRVWRWYDPELLQAILPSLAPSQLDEVFAVGQVIVIVTSGAWIWNRLEHGVLAQDTRALDAAARP